MASLKVACLVLMCMAVVSAPIAQAITCGQVVSSLSACIGYLTSGGPVPGGCCGGVKNLLALSPTPADRKTACNCLKQAAKNIPRYNDQNAQSLPGKCGVRIPYKISVSTNCATVN